MIWKLELPGLGGGEDDLFKKKERNVRRDRSEFAQGGEFIDTGITGVKKRRGSLC